MRICTEAVQMGSAPARLVYAAGREDELGLAALIAACKRAGGRALPVTESLLKRISRKDNAQMVIGAFAQELDPPDQLASPADTAPQLLIALDRVRDPGNLGTIMRTADAVAAQGLILIDDCTDPYSVEALEPQWGRSLMLISSRPRQPVLRLYPPGRARLSAQPCRPVLITAARTGPA